MDAQTKKTFWGKIRRTRDAGLRVELDRTEGKSPGWKFNYYWEMKRVPVRIEVEGPRTWRRTRASAPGEEETALAISKIITTS